MKINKFKEITELILELQTIRNLEIGFKYSDFNDEKRNKEILTLKICELIAGLKHIRLEIE